MYRLPTRIRSLLLLALAVLLVVPAPSQSGAGGGTVKVMTYNINEGSDFVEVLSAQNLADFVQAVQTTLDQVDASNPPLRMQAVAHQIAINQPDLVGLQEVSTWLVGPPSNPAVRYDMLQELMAALAAQGQKYKIVAVVPEFQLAGPLPPAGPNYLFVQDTDVMLARDKGDLAISNVQWGTYATLLPVNTPGGSFEIKRGWGSADVSLHGQQFRFIVTHIENYIAQAPLTLLIQQAQAAELAAGPANVANMPVIIAGDFNADALGKDASIATHQLMESLGFTDAWQARYPNLAAPTWPLLDSSPNNSSARQRIDYIWTSGDIRPLNLTQASSAPQDKVNGLWPSDHAGVRAHLQFGRN